jgi:SAM-dependent MidA family methyltransferase
VGLEDVLRAEIAGRGPMTVAAFIDRALYDPVHGYYCASVKRSGRGGDFYTSVDIGPLFGELLARQFAQMWQLLGERDGQVLPRIDLVEAGAGTGRLACDVLDAAARDAPTFHQAANLHLVERSAAARSGHAAMLSAHESKLVTSSAVLPAEVDGIVYSNELLDAFPPHAIVMREGGLRELYVDVGRDGLAIVEGRLSTDRIEQHLARVGAQLEPGWRADISLEAIDWVHAAARALRRGFLVLIDYGHEAAELYSRSHAMGTIVTYSGHRADPNLRAILCDPGNRDITAHVDLTGIRQAAEAHGLELVALLDQTYFLLGLAGPLLAAPREELTFKRRLALKTLLLPGGLGSTQKVMIFGKDVGVPDLIGCSVGSRLT